MLVTLLVSSVTQPSSGAVLAGITALSRLGEVRRVDVAARPLRFMVDVAGGAARPVPLAGVLADALGLPVQETGVEAS